MSNFPPVFIMLAGAAIVPIFPARVRAYAFLAAPVLVLVQLLLWLNDASSLEVRLAGISLNLLDVNDLNRVWATVFTLVALGGGIFALHVRQRIQQSAALAYAGCALGVVLAGDLITLITFWELASIASFFLIANGGRARSLAAAKRYIFVHIAGGSALLGGILWHAGDTGSFAITTFEGGAGWLALIGVLVNAAAFPLHAWLSDAYPESSPTGMVFLGAFTTKSAVYVLAVLFSGWGVLLIIGAFMALHGTIYALMQNDIRRIIAFHIISQVGIMVIAVGVGGNERARYHSPYCVRAYRLAGPDGDVHGRSVLCHRNHETHGTGRPGAVVTAVGAVAVHDPSNLDHIRPAAARCAQPGSAPVPRAIRRG